MVLRAAERQMHLELRPKVAYLTDVDFAPDGSWFAFTSTGFVPRETAEIGTHLCDAVARFETANISPALPTWINYTGGDTLRGLAITGAAVYVQGHNRWLDNPYGKDFAGPGAVERKGGGAVDPLSGKALDWNPVKPARVGGYSIPVTEAGVWFPSDGSSFSSRYHYGIAFTPLP